MATLKEVREAGHARFTYRLRVSSSARAALNAERSRCRWIWNESVAKSKQTHQNNRALPEGADKSTCGPVQLAKMLTAARAKNEWLRDGARVPRQQLIRDFGKSRAKALKDIKARLPMRQRAGMPKYKKKRESAPTLEYTRRGFRLKDGRLHLAGGIAVTVVWSRELPSTPSSVRVHRDSLGHWYASFVVATETEPLLATGAAIGIDWGVKETATTTSDAHDLPRAHHDGLRRLRSESQARAAAVRTHPHVHRVRSLPTEGQELRQRDARPGWSRTRPALIS